MRNNEVTINGITYIAVDAPLTSCPCSYCDAIDECIGHNEDVLCAIHNCVDKIFKESVKYKSNKD